MSGIVLALIAATTCAVTTPNGVMARGGTEPCSLGCSLGNELLSAGPFGIPPAGTFISKPGGPGFVTRGGSLGHKFGWQTSVSGTFVVEGRRLDGPAPPMWADNATGQLIAPGFHATALIFPTPGCWEVTGRVGDASLTFVVNVEKVGDGPSWHRDELP
jgi:hypothetical protein